MSVSVCMHVCTRDTFTLVKQIHSLMYSSVQQIFIDHYSKHWQYSHEQKMLKAKEIMTDQISLYIDF